MSTVRRPEATPTTDGPADAPGDVAAVSAAAADGWAMLDGMRRRLDEQGAQTRKTAAQVQQLAESIGALVAAQRRRSRWLNINSFVAYLVFTVLCSVAFYFLYESRARDLIADRDRAAGERDQAVRRADDAGAKLAARDATDAKALTAAQVKTAKDAQVAQAAQVDTALKSAAAAAKTGRYADAAATLEGALGLQGAAARGGELHYQLGMADVKLGAIDKAAAQFQAAVAADVAEEDARFQLASALDRLGQWAKARAEYDRFATAHPQSPFAVYALRRSAMLAHMPAVGPWVAPGGAAPAPTSAPVAPPAAPALKTVPAQPPAPATAPPAAPPKSDDASAPLTPTSSTP